MVKKKSKGWRGEPTRHGLSSRGVETTSKGKKWNEFKKQVSMIAKDLSRNHLYEDDLDYFEGPPKKNEEREIRTAMRSELKEMKLWEESYNIDLMGVSNIAKIDDYSKHDCVYLFVVRDTSRITSQVSEAEVRGWIGIDVNSNNTVEDAMFKISGMRGIKNREKLIDYIEEENE